MELIVNRIESSALDIAPNYADWRDLGFALADALGESGRNYYHRQADFIRLIRKAKPTNNTPLALLRTATALQSKHFTTLQSQQE